MSAKLSNASTFWFDTTPLCTNCCTKDAFSRCALRSLPVLVGIELPDVLFRAITFVVLIAFCRLCLVCSASVAPVPIE